MNGNSGKKRKPYKLNPANRFSEPKKKMIRAYNSMMARCYKTNAQSYYNYGARGITVCDEWRNNKQQFFIDMGEPPSMEHSIDKINNDLPYSKQNCRWATKSEQAVNRKTTKFITHNGETLPMKHWAKKVGIEYRTLWARLNLYGMSVEDSLNPRIIPQTERNIWHGGYSRDL